MLSEIDTGEGISLIQEPRVSRNNILPPFIKFWKSVYLEISEYILGVNVNQSIWFCCIFIFNCLVALLFLLFFLLSNLLP